MNFQNGPYYRGSHHNNTREGDKMLTLTIPGEQSWDPVKAEFHYTAPTELKLEHSLLSLAKWESKWHIPFFLFF